MPLPVPKVQIDFDNSGAFETSSFVFTDDGAVARFLGLLGTPLVTPDPGEDVSARLLAPLSAERGRNQVKSLSPPVANDVQGVLGNVSGDYSPDNVASPLYPNVDLGRLLRYSMTRGATTYEIARGYVDQIAPHPEWERREVEISALSQLARLVRQDGFSSPLYGDGTIANAIRADEAMHIVFDLAEIPIDRCAFDVCQTKLLFFVVRPVDELFDLAIRIWASEGPGSRLYDGADGLSYLTQRYAQLTDARSSTVQATFRDSATEPYFVGWEPDSGEQSVVNICSVAWKRREIDAADAQIWQFGAAITLAAGESRQFTVQPATDDPIASVVAPVLTTDYTVTAGALAGAPAFDRSSGPFVTMTLTGGAAGATIAGPAADPTRGIQVRGKLARVTASSQIVNTIDTQLSIDRYGPKPYTLPTLPEIDYLVLQDFANAVVGVSQWPRPMRTIEVPLVTDTHIASTLPREPGDRVRVVNGREGFDREMFVEYVRVVWPERGVPAAFLGCEAAVDPVGDYAFWDQGLWDVGLWAY